MGNAIAYRYLKEVKRCLPETAADRRKFLKDFEENLGSYLQEMPKADREDLVQRFGSPETIAESFLLDAPTGEALVTEKKKKLRKRILAIFFVVCAILLIGLFAFRVWDMYSFHTGQYVVNGDAGLPPDHSDAFASF